LLSLLERNGLFLAGTVLVGTMAYQAYANMPGVKWASELATRDMDIAADNRFTVALPRPKKPISLCQIVLDSGMGFFEVPALNREQPRRFAAGSNRPSAAARAESHGCGSISSWSPYSASA